MIFLSEPDVRYKESFLEGLREFHQEGRMLQHDQHKLANDFASFVQRLHAAKEHSSMAPARVPSSEFWLIDDEEFIGYLSLRHTLNDFLLKVGGHIGYLIRPSKRRRGYGTEQLRLGLHKAYAIGITRVLLTCDETNIASKKVIENNGGLFENAIQVEGSSIQKLRYWIEIPA